MNLNDMRDEIDKLVKAKGFGNDQRFRVYKLFFAILEIAELGEMIKKGPEIWQEGKWKDKPIQWKEKQAEELIDAIFYILDVSRLICPEVDLDKAFIKKLQKNWNRPFQYGVSEGYKIYKNLGE